ncbi:histidine phosphatase family protein [Comamonas sp. Y33R10-2]|uniref:histidine phosphatase family protein n=1 Tax=Comamonas sp. Y33R10-2 TaxID=2853257 RepID=UPI001C5CAEF1|nr:histidine phosphatase family protein [Comamonas sp. Y33R10-2]QXZ11230.1 histidine phosphatase family protein [Comamonas sp. Y33R10-2]
MKTLWLVRHARPLIDTERCYGRLDVTADAQATEQAAQALHQALLPLKGNVQICHSPLQRCEQLANDLQRLEPDFISKPDSRLLEINFGHWEGQRWDDIGQAAISVWTHDLAQHRPGAGESLAQMLERVSQALQDARRSPSPHVVWICHAGVARCVQWLVQHGSQIPQSHEWVAPAPAYGKWMQIQISEPQLS